VTSLIRSRRRIVGVAVIGALAFAALAVAAPAAAGRGEHHAEARSATQANSPGGVFGWD
jgi:hypothetical protein